MATVTTEQYNALIARLNFIEALMNNVLVALQKFCTIDQAVQLSNIRQTEIGNLDTRITTLENTSDNLREALKI